MSISALPQPLPPARFTEFRILPAGLFRSSDGSGRPDGLAGWIMNRRIADRLIADLAARDDTPIDYEHQSLHASTNGRPAPAAGWFSDIEWREGDGLYAKNVRWTDKARQMIAALEYRFISPVFSFNKATGEVAKIISLGLVNTPALSGLTDLAAARAEALAVGLCGADRPKSIETFNRHFGRFGVLHPHTDWDGLREVQKDLAAGARANQGAQEEGAALAARAVEIRNECLAIGIDISVIEAVRRAGLKTK